MARRGRHKGGGGHEGGDERWLLTYADMITLLLALFIVLFAMSSIDATKFDAVARSLSESFSGEVFNGNNDVLTGSNSVLDPSATSGLPSSVSFEVKQDSQQRQKSAYAQQAQKLEELTKTSKAAGVSVSTVERGIVVSLAGDTTFESGSAQLRPEAIRFLDKLSVQLVENRNQIAIEGHTDGQPISGGAYPSNWHLSGGRALSVLVHLQRDGVLSSHMRYVGFSDTKPVVKPATPTSAETKNRRVEIVILAPASEGSAAAPGSRAPASASSPQAIGSPVGQPRAGIADQPIDLIGPLISVSKG